MIERKDHEFLVHHVERVAKLARVPDAGHMTNVRLVPTQEIHEHGRTAIREAEHDLMAELLLRGVASDASQNWKSRGHGLIDDCRSPISMYERTRSRAGPK